MAGELGRGLTTPVFWVDPLDYIPIKDHYQYLELVMSDFFQEIFGNDIESLGYRGFEVAHGDKCYQYKNSWEEKGIHFYRGALLYLLTYTNKLGDYKKSQSQKWVIDHYAEYLPLIEKVESQHHIVFNHG